jgi:two-component system, response regulator, stage 0 sporulation protein F
MSFPAKGAFVVAKILLVEDDPNQRLLYEQELTNDGYEVVTARDGREALEQAEKTRPDLVVMDISMPGMDGIEAMSRMLSQDHKLPIILNTAYATYKESFRAWSADAYVVKSSDLTELKSTIKRVLGVK